jgi:hypothetical protein
MIVLELKCCGALHKSVPISKYCSRCGGRVEDIQDDSADFRDMYRVTPSYTYIFTH